ncbi:MAG: hypothetical protein AAFX85_10395 [Pseudomonadota bacterium]
MANALITALLLVLIPAVALNLWLTLRLASRLRVALTREAPLTCPVDQTVPAFSGRRLTDGELIDQATLAGQANVLVFLSSACADCRSKLPVLLDLLAPMERHGIQCWLLSQEPEARARKFFTEHALAQRVVRLGRREYQQLNPRGAAPLYLFVDDQQVVRAGNFIGDANWMAFVDQIRDVTPMREAS